jgi:hypothetical protein
LKNKTIEIRRMTPMTDILKRDITGECEGECRDLVREGEEEVRMKFLLPMLNLQSPIQMQNGRDPEMNRPAL